MRPGQAAPAFRLMWGSSLESDAEFDARYTPPPGNWSFCYQSLIFPAQVHCLLRQSRHWRLGDQEGSCWIFLDCTLFDPAMNWAFFTHLRICALFWAFQKQCNTWVKVNFTTMFASREWVTFAPWTWCLSPQSLPQPWGLAGGSMTSPSPPGL